MFYFSSPVKAISAVGIVASDPKPLEPVFPRQDEAQRVFCSFQPVVKLENPLRFSDCVNLPKKLVVRGTGQVAGENVGALVAKIRGANPGLSEQLAI